MLLLCFCFFLPMAHAVFPKEISNKKVEKPKKVEASHKERPLYLHLHITKESIKDIFRFVVKIRNRSDKVSTYLNNSLSTKTHTLMTNYNEMGEPSPILIRLLLIDINRLIVGSSIYNQDTFSDVKLAQETGQLLKQENVEGEALVKLNRMLLEDAYPHEIIPLKRDTGGFFSKAKPIVVEVSAKDYQQRFLDLYAGKTFNTPLMPKQEKEEKTTTKKLPVSPEEKSSGTLFWIAGGIALVGLFWILKQFGSHTS